MSIKKTKFTLKNENNHSLFSSEITENNIDDNEEEVIPYPTEDISFTSFSSENTEKEENKSINNKKLIEVEKFNLDEEKIKINYNNKMIKNIEEKENILFKEKSFREERILEKNMKIINKYDKELKKSNEQEKIENLKEENKILKEKLIEENEFVISLKDEIEFQNNKEAEFNQKMLKKKQKTFLLKEKIEHLENIQNAQNLEKKIQELENLQNSRSLDNKKEL